MSQHINPDRQNNINEILNKTKNITIRKVLKYHTVRKVLKYHTVRKVLKYHTVRKVLKYHTVREAPKSNRNLETESKSIPRTHMIVHFPGLEKVLE
jgi:hypothetical protein